MPFEPSQSTLEGSQSQVGSCENRLSDSIGIMMGGGVEGVLPYARIKLLSIKRSLIMTVLHCR